MSSKVHWNAEHPLEPISWPSADTPGNHQSPNPVHSPRGQIPGGQRDPQSKSRRPQSENEQGTQAAYTQGYQDGAQAGQREAETQVKAVTERLAHSIDEITGLRQRLRHEAEADVVALSIAIARRVLHREITMDPEALLGLAKATLEKLDIRDLHRVRTHPESAPMLQELLEKIGLPRRVEVVADPSLERGAVILETGRGMLDASVETQLVEIERGFADMVRHAP